ncbi:efflux RND transporter permease subunit [Polaromonas sp. P1(28)-13]|nr:efflux RND transporter permease subunit [Polaromonas sp. P1(28)-13]
MRNIPVDVFPEFAPPVVEVQTEAIGLSADEVQDLITLNLEELLSGVPWLESIRSQSVTGLSSIVLTFKRGTDIMKARQMIQERLTLAYTLPNVAQPPVILQPLSATSRFMMIGISSDKVEPTELSLLTRWTIKPRLLGVPGVANVAIWGQRLRQMHVQIDPNRLRDAKVLQEDIIAATGDALWVSPLTFLKGSAPGTGGWIDNRNQRLGVQHTMPIETPEDMAKVAVTTPSLLLSGKSLSLGEVTEVSFSHPPLIGDAVLKNGNGLMLVIEKFPSANTLEVTRGVDQALAELSRGLPGVQIDAKVFRLASYVQDSISNLTQAIAIGGVLVILVIGAFLFNWRSALISVVSITLSLLAAVIALHLTGATINTMILAGLIVALSVVIDDVVFDVDTLRGRLRAQARQRRVDHDRDLRHDHGIATRRPLRDPDRDTRCPSHLFHGRGLGRVLRTAGHCLPAGSGGVHGGGTHRNPRA